MSVIPPAWVAFVAMVWKNRGPNPLWMAYGGVLTSRLVWLPGPTLRFSSGDGSGPTSFPNVRVPLIVTFPLGPHTVALYLEISCLSAQRSRSKGLQPTLQDNSKQGSQDPQA